LLDKCVKLSFEIENLHYRRISINKKRIKLQIRNLYEVLSLPRALSKEFVYLCFFFFGMSCYNIYALIYTRMQATQAFHFEWLISTKPLKQVMDYNYLLNIEIQ